MKKLRALPMSALLVSPGVFAQIEAGSITFTPGGVSAVPALGGTMLILLAGLLVVIAMKAAQRNRHGGGIASLFVGVLLVGSLASAFSGVSVIQKVQAGVDPTLIIVPAGETFDVNCSFSEFTNSTDVEMTVTELTPPIGCSSEINTAETACALDVTLQNDESCFLDFDGIQDDNIA